MQDIVGQHWSVETLLPRKLDVLVNEDWDGARTANGPPKLAFLGRTALDAKQEEAPKAPQEESSTVQARTIATSPPY